MSLARRHALLAGLSGGTPPATPTFDFFILAGQSNTGNTPASGMSAPQKALYDITVPNTNIWNPEVASAIQPLNVGVNTAIGNPFYTDTFGPEAAWFVQLNGFLPKARYLFKLGVGNTSLANDWNSRAVSGVMLYSGMLASLDTLLLTMAAGNIVPNLKAFVWMQGETDATDSTMAAAYQTNLQNFFNDFKTYWNSRSTTYNLPAAGKNFLTIIPQINAPGEAFRTTVRAAETAYCAIGGNNATLLNTDGYSNGGGGLHYDQTGQIQFGSDLFTLTKNL